MIRPGIQTPWGIAEDVTHVADGIYFVSTPSHGGYFVAPEQRIGAGLDPARAWYEEDCAWALLAIARPDLFPAHALDAARAVVEHARSRGRSL
jgi:hypothetical protein